MSVSELGGSPILSVTDKSQRRDGDVQEIGMNSEHASRICQVTDSYFRLGCPKRGLQGLSRVKLRRTQPGQCFPVYCCERTLLDEVGISQTCQRPTFTAAAMPGASQIVLFPAFGSRGHRRAVRGNRARAAGMFPAARAFA